MHHLPDTPFSYPYLWVVDGLRVVCSILIAGVFGFYANQTFLNRRLDLRERIRCAGLCLVLIVVFFTVIGRLGHAITWRLIVSFLGAAFLTWGNGGPLRRGGWRPVR